MENFITFVLILSSIAISSASPTTSTTEASEFKDPRDPTFFERMFFTGLDMGVNLSETFLPKVMKNSQYLPKFNESWSNKMIDFFRIKIFYPL